MLPHNSAYHVIIFIAMINDFSIQVATVNGSGSQSANNVLMRAIFQMGVPVSGKNLFPSNIAGLPTWFTIRANKDGYIARKADDRFCHRHESADGARGRPVGGRQAERCWRKPLWA